jgi:hypothetical protein
MSKPLLRGGKEFVRTSILLQRLHDDALTGDFTLSWLLASLGERSYGTEDGLLLALSMAAAEGDAQERVLASTGTIGGSPSWHARADYRCAGAPKGKASPGPATLALRRRIVIQGRVFQPMSVG